MVVAVGLVVLISPLLAAIGVIMLVGPGPMFYVHRRVGYGGMTFGCLKFRTMCPHAESVLEAHFEGDPEMRREWLATRKIKRDPRVTHFGRFLRRASLDELPQLFNVLRGDMSIVGPRPIVSEELRDHYGEAAKLYLSVKPGLTGLWQVKGRSDTNYQQRVALDCEYILNQSLLGDIHLLFRTVFVLLRRRGAY